MYVFHPISLVCVYHMAEIWYMWMMCLSFSSSRMSTKSHVQCMNECLVQPFRFYEMMCLCVSVCMCGWNLNV